MTQSSSSDRKPGHYGRAIVAGLIAGIAAGLIANLLFGLVGFIIGFIAGATVAARTTMIASRPRDQAT